MPAAASPAALAPTVVAVIAYDGISPFHLSVPSVVFGNERDAAATPVFDFRVFGRARPARDHRRLHDHRAARARCARRRRHRHRARMARPR
jgi:hypothetical protein